LSGIFSFNWPKGGPVAKDGNTYAKKARETLKRQKAQEKRERRQKRKDLQTPETPGPAILVATGSDAADLGGV
jgi:hypothetical protein